MIYNFWFKYRQNSQLGLVSPLREKISFCAFFQRIMGQNINLSESNFVNLVKSYIGKNFELYKREITIIHMIYRGKHILTIVFIAFLYYIFT